MLSLCGCHAAKPADPAESYKRIYAKFLEGHLDVAQRAASAEKIQLLDRDPWWSFRFCLLEAEVLQFKGDSQEVVNVIHGQRQPPSADDNLKIKQDILLGLADARLGRTQQSVDEMHDAERLTQVTHSALEGEVLRTQGILALRNGQPAAAEELFRQSLGLARKQNDAYLEASNLLNLGKVSLTAEHIDEALDRFNQSSQLSSSIHANVILQFDEGNAGWAYYALGDFQRALDSFRQAEAQARALGATDSEILWLQSAGLTLSRLGDLKQAQSCYEEGLRAAQASHDTARRAQTETSLGLLFLQVNQLAAARDHAGEALKAAQQLGDKPSELDASLLQALIAAQTSSGPEPERMLFQVLHDAEKMPSMRWEAEGALASLYASRRLPIQAEQWYRRSIETFETQRESVHDEERRLPFFANGDDLYRRYADFLISSQRSLEALHLLNSARARTLKEGLGGRGRNEGSRPYPFPTLVLRGEGVVLFYSLGTQRSYLWEMDRTGTRFFLLPPEAEIAARIKSYQASILKSRDPLFEQNPESLWLYEKLVAPVEAFIPANSRVLVIPDGSLNGFNLETLLKAGPQGIHYWIEDVNLTTSTSIQLFSHETRSRNSQQDAKLATGKLLLIGDPLAAGGDYTSLPHAAEEVNSIQQYFPEARRTTLTQAAAAPAAYATSHPEQYAYVHFVAHGMASSLRPLDSAIVLSPSSPGSDLFKLYARDIVQQPLNARLVTISACYGSGVHNFTEEGLVGLSWAFLRAGAHQVIGALWQVNDSSTPHLMDLMYRGLAEGAPPDRALRAAKLSMLHSQGVYRKPLYWAAFQLYAGS